jgi:hypothetical protein
MRAAAHGLEDPDLVRRAAPRRKGVAGISSHSRCCETDVRQFRADSAPENSLLGREENHRVLEAAPFGTAEESFATRIA